MYMYRRGSAVLIAASVMAALTGCIEPTPEPSLSVSATAHDFGTTGSQWSFQVWNSGQQGSILTWETVADESWIGLSHTAGTSTGPNDKDTVTVSIDRGSLSKATYSGIITVSASGLPSQLINISASVTPPTADFTENRRSGNAPLSVEFTDVSTPGSSPITMWRWDFGDGAASTAQHTNHTYANPGTYTVSLTVYTDVATHTESKDGYITVFDTAGEGEGETVAVPNVVGLSQSAAESTVTSEGLIIGTVALAYSDTVAEGSVISHTPVAGSRVPPGSLVDLLVSLGPEPVTVPNVVGLEESFAQSAITIAGLTVGTVAAQFSDMMPAGQVMSQSPIAGIPVPLGTAIDLIVSKGPAVGPAAAFSGTPRSGDAPLTVQFSDESVPGSFPISSWVWGFGDGGTSNQPHPSHTYSTAGTYTVSLTVTTPVDSATETRTDYISVSSAPVGPTAAFTAEHTAGEAPLTIQFTDESAPGTSSISSWLWSLGDGEMSSGQSPSHTYRVEGVYAVSLTVTTSVGSDTESKADYIIVTSAPVLPTAAFSGTPRSGDAPLTVQFSDESVPGSSSISTWAWGFGDGGISSEPNPSHTYSTAGTFTVSLTVTTSVGSDAITMNRYVIVNMTPVEPTAAFTAAPSSGDAPLTVQFVDESEPGSSSIESWAWDFGDGDISSAPNPSHTYRTAGTFTVSLTVSSSVGFHTETKVGYISISSTPVGPTAAFTADRTVGEVPLTVQFMDESSAGSSSISSWLWNFGNGETSAEQSPSHTYAAEGVYTVSLTVTTSVDSDTETKADLITVNEAVALTVVSGHTYYAGSTIPVSGVTVQIGTSTATSGGSGQYTLIDVPVGVQNLTAFKEGYDGYSRTLDIPAESFVWDVEMTSGSFTHTLSGTVFNGMTSPEALAGVTVSVLNPDGTSSLLVDTADFTGHYQIASVPQGSRVIRFEKDCYDTAEPTVFMSNTDKVYIEQILASVVEPPGNVSAVANWVESTIVWQADPESCDILGFNLHRSPALDSGYEQMNGSLITGTSFDDILPNNFVPYYYKVSTVNAEGMEGPLSEAVSVQPQTGGVISQDTMWQGQISVLSDVTVSEATTLEIASGTDVQFAQVSLIVHGALIAVGTEAETILFSSAAEMPAPGDWDGIHFTSNSDDARSRMVHSIIEYAGPGVTNTDTSPSFDNCLFIRNSTSNSAGGGMYNFNSSPTVTNCTFSHNAATRTHGGGMYNLNSSPTVMNCTFSQNSAVVGGGMSNTGASTSPRIVGCTFVENFTSGSGGGMANSDSSSPILENCTFLRNSSSVGGGIENFLGVSLTVIGCIFSGNSSSWLGGGIYSESSTAILENCSFLENSAAASGGGIDTDNSSLTLTNCTFFGNSARGHSFSDGGGISSVRSTVTVTNSIFWDNVPDELQGNFIATYNNILGGWEGEGNIDADPLFEDPEDGNLRLQPGSPCIDAGLSDNAPETDKDGNPRYDDPATPNTGAGAYPYYDMGAYEYQGP